ncbi:hypothetical protein [Actinospica robiniae]|uniref:hypothetical protein n=1 Tax=Actinospica robiniae TaxID=304901 RepID=UPI0004013F23|nr:hypothetical protein [Actinospica robiniae]
MTDAEQDGFDEIVCYGAWWDCPRTGVALIGGRPHYFECNFSAELDDYPARYELWPISEGELAEELELWRDRLERLARAQVTGPPVERLPAHLAEVDARVLERNSRRSPADALIATPEWRLDRNRSKIGRVPAHRVRWTFAESAAG